MFAKEVIWLSDVYTDVNIGCVVVSFPSPALTAAKLEYCPAGKA